MAAAAGIFSHAMTAGQALAAKTASPMDSSTSGTGSSSDSGDSATISANDFLTLLVTEMQNQDPTADTDPNEYVNQLVQVNSLEQLININQTLTGDLGAPPAGASTNSVPGQAANPLSGSIASQTANATPPSAIAAPEHSASAAGPAAARRGHGNLSVPAASAASQRVAQALDGRPHARPMGGRLAAFERNSLNRNSLNRNP
jgi:flagellar basal-body rod modification protein FlgD